jgi:hypothetical protein
VHNTSHTLLAEILGPLLDDHAAVLVVDQPVTAMTRPLVREWSIIRNTQHHDVLPMSPLPLPRRATSGPVGVKDR